MWLYRTNPNCFIWNIGQATRIPRKDRIRTEPREIIRTTFSHEPINGIIPATVDMELYNLMKDTAYQKKRRLSADQDGHWRMRL